MLIRSRAAFCQRARRRCHDSSGRVGFPRKEIARHATHRLGLWLLERCARGPQAQVFNPLVAAAGVFENFDEKGAARPSAFTSGRIMYDAAGQMAAQLMQSNRKPLSTPSTEAERAIGYAGYLSYFGRYSVDPSAQTVTHHVEGSTNPNWVSTPTHLVRSYAFSADGNRLTLSVKNAAGRVTGTLTWERIRDLSPADSHSDSAIDNLSAATQAAMRGSRAKRCDQCQPCSGKLQIANTHGADSRPASPVLRGAADATPRTSRETLHRRARGLIANGRTSESRAASRASGKAI